MRSSVFIAILVLCACQKAAAPPSPAAASNARPATLADAEVATMTEELTELFDKVATAIERAGVDRDAVAIGINRVADAHSNPLERMAFSAIQTSSDAAASGWMNTAAPR